MQEKFGALLDAFEYGAPPHGGIALGIDRWAALLTRQANIREVMVFPKTQSGSDLMLEAPAALSAAQLDELHLRVIEPEQARGCRLQSCGDDHLHVNPRLTCRLCVWPTQIDPIRRCLRR